MTGQIEVSQPTRRAFVYVRQSSMAQVLHHQESTMMQYDLRQRAIALGWAPEAIEVIDEDQARTGTTTEGRSGFSRVADAVAHGEAGASPPRFHAAGRSRCVLNGTLPIPLPRCTDSSRGRWHEAARASRVAINGTSLSDTVVLTLSRLYRS